MLDPVFLDYTDIVKPYLKQVKDWHLVFCFLPKHCALTDKKMWFSSCFKGSRIVYDLRVTISAKEGTVKPYRKPISKEYYYISKNDFLIWKLTQ